MARIEPPEEGEPDGCLQCQEGRKLVLFVTGRCHWKCDYCPLSETRRESSTMFANERACTSMEEVIEEARAMDASGTGITGGDPMMDKEASLVAIRALKDAFGAGHHIHLYTSIPVESAIIDDLADAGLDELRFHLLDLNLARYRSVLAAASASGMAVGIELPSMPDQRQEMFDLIEDLRDTDIDFLNLNELELTVGNDEQMSVRGFNLGVSSPAGAEGSLDLANDLKSRIIAADNGQVDPFDGERREPYGFHLKVCTASYKDAGQLRARFRRRAEHTLRPHEALTEDDTLVFGVILSDQAVDLDNDAESFLSETGLSSSSIRVDSNRQRIEIPFVVAEDLAGDIDRPVAMVEVHPTHERLEVSLIWLNEQRPSPDHPGA